MKAVDVCRHLVGWMLLSMAVACGEDGPTGEALVERWIADDPQILLERDQLFDAEQVFRWTFASEADVAPWQAFGASASRVAKRRWRLRAAGDESWIERSVQLEAAEMHALEVTLVGAVGEARLFWAGPREAFAEKRSLAAKAPAPRRRRPATLTFDLAGHPRWRGQVERLRLEPTGAGAGEVELQSIRGVRRVANPERLAEALGRGWKIDLSADARNALLAVPGVPIDRRLEIGHGQRLRFAYGLEATVRQPIEFRIEATVEGGEGADLLWVETLDPSSGGAGDWRQAELDLGAYAGRGLRLVFETRSPELLDLARGFPAWGHPEILGPGATEGPPNVIFISLDTLRSDRLSAYGHHRPTSPNLERWAARSAVLFEHAVAQAPWTLPSHASMFTGLDALRHDVNHYRAAPPSLEMLAETLRRAGYATAAITGGGYLRPQFGFAQGFDSFRYWPQILGEPELADGMERLLAWLDDHHARRFFLFFHTYEIHFPHRRRQPFFDRFKDGDQARAITGEAGVRGEITMRARPLVPGNPLWQHDVFKVKLESGDEVEHLNEAEKALLRVMYDSSIAYADAQLGRLFQRLEALDLTRRTLIVVTSDHGEALGESDRAGHNYLEDYNAMVPLVISFPDGLGAGRRIDRQVRSIDVVPTLLEALGLPPAQPLDGVSLLPLIAGEPGETVPEEAWIYASSASYGLGLRYGGRLKYLFNNTAWSPYLGDERLYDLRRDPAETEDLAASHPSTEELRAKVRHAIEAQHEGLRLRVTNRSAGVLSGRLKHDWVRHNRVKAADPSCQCFSWGGSKSGAFSLAPGQKQTLYFESIPGNRLGLEGQLELPGRPPAAFDEVFDPRQLEEPIGLVYSTAGWHRESPPEDAAIAFTLWRRSERGLRPIERPVDARIQQQLKALGYVQ